MHKKWLILIIPGLIAFSYFIIDKPLVFFLFTHHSRDWQILYIFADYIPLAIVIFIFLFYLYFSIKLSFFRLTLNDKRLMITSNAIAISIFLKDSLKVIFGRYWPNTFTCNNPSLLDHGVFGFNWFTQGQAYASFPSGHATLIFAFAVSMWSLYPKFRWVWVALPACVVIGQVGMYFHFMSDVIAGGLLGSLVAVLNLKYLAQKNYSIQGL